MKPFLNKIFLKKKEQPKNVIEIPKQYIAFLRSDYEVGLTSELIDKEDLERLVLKDREKIRYIFEYKDLIRITNEVVEIKQEENN